MLPTHNRYLIRIFYDCKSEDLKSELGRGFMSGWEKGMFPKLNRKKERACLDIISYDLGEVEEYKKAIKADKEIAERGIIVLGYLNRLAKRDSNSWIVEISEIERRKDRYEKFYEYNFCKACKELEQYKMIGCNKHNIQLRYGPESFLIPLIMKSITNEKINPYWYGWCYIHPNYPRLKCSDENAYVILLVTDLSLNGKGEKRVVFFNTTASGSIKVNPDNPLIATISYNQLKKEPYKFGCELGENIRKICEKSGWGIFKR